VAPTACAIGGAGGGGRVARGCVCRCVAGEEKVKG